MQIHTFQSLIVTIETDIEDVEGVKQDGVSISYSHYRNLYPTLPFCKGKAVSISYSHYRNGGK